MYDVQVTISSGRYVNHSYAIIPRQNDIVIVNANKTNDFEGKFIVDRVELNPHQAGVEKDTVDAIVYVSKI